MSDDAVALELGRRLLERSTLTAEDVRVIVTDARRAVAKVQLVNRLVLLIGKGASFPTLQVRETIRRVLSEMDAIELGQDVPAPKTEEPAKKESSNASDPAQRKATTQTGHPRAEGSTHGGKPAVPAHGSQPAGTGGKSPGPATHSQGRT